MRRLINIVFCLWGSIAPARTEAQKSFVWLDSASKSMLALGQYQDLYQLGRRAHQQGSDYFAVSYRAGLAAFTLQRYQAAEDFFRRALEQNQASAESREMRYLSLLYLGRDLEASKVLLEGDRLFESKPAQGVESFDLDAGVKLSVNSHFGNIGYVQAGMLQRLNKTSRLRQAIASLWQDKNNDGFTQYEYFCAYTRYTGAGLSVRPSVHGAYALFNKAFSTTVPEFYQYSLGPTVYQTDGRYQAENKVPGTAYALNAAINLSLQKSAWTMTFEPSLHYSHTRYHYEYNYHRSGVVDSFLNGSHLGTESYNDNGEGKTSDTTVQNLYGQLTAGLTFHLPFWNEHIRLRAMCYYVFDDHGNDLDFSAHLFAQLSKQWWLHAIWLSKGNYPLAQNAEGIYYNAGSAVKERWGATLQWRPLRKLSPMVTYQHERQFPFAGGETMIFNCFYLTLKYTL